MHQSHSCNICKQGFCHKANLTEHKAKHRCNNCKELFPTTEEAQVKIKLKSTQGAGKFKKSPSQKTREIK